MLVVLTWGDRDSIPLAQEYLAMSADSFGCHNWGSASGSGCYCYTVRSSQRCCSTYHDAQINPSQQSSIGPKMSIVLNLRNHGSR